MNIKLNIWSNNVLVKYTFNIQIKSLDQWLILTTHEEPITIS